MAVIYSQNGTIVYGRGSGIKYLSYFDNYDSSTGFDTPRIGRPVHILDTNIELSKVSDTVSQFPNSINTLQIRTNQDGGIVQPTFELDGSEPFAVELLWKCINVYGYLDVTIQTSVRKNVGFIYIGNTSKVWAADSICQLSEIDRYNGTTYSNTEYDAYFFNVPSNCGNYTQLYNKVAFYADTVNNKVYLYLNGILLLGVPYTGEIVSLRASPHSNNTANYSSMRITQMCIKTDISQYVVEP